MDKFDYYFEHKLSSCMMDGEEYIDLIKLFDIFETNIDKNIESVNFIKMIINTLDFMDED